MDLYQPGPPQSWKPGRSKKRADLPVNARLIDTICCELQKTAIVHEGSCPNYLHRRAQANLVTRLLQARAPAWPNGLSFRLLELLSIKPKNVYRSTYSRSLIKPKRRKNESWRALTCIQCEQTAMQNAPPLPSFIQQRLTFTKVVRNEETFGKLHGFADLQVLTLRPIHTARQRQRWVCTHLYFFLCLTLACVMLTAMLRLAKI